MKKIRVFLYALIVIFLVQGFDAHAQEAKARWEIMNLIRKEKLDTILPQSMRENNIDMWILVNRYGRRDPLSKELGGGDASDKWYQGNFLAYVVFTDRGGDRIERAALGTYGVRVSPLSGQKRDFFKVHSVPALNDFIVSTILSKK